MRVTNRSKNVAKLGATAALALGLTVAFQPVAGAVAPERELTVSPSTSLSHGATVTVAVSGFTPGGRVVLAQCAVLGGKDVCPENSLHEAAVDGDGVARVPLTVQRTFKAFYLDGAPAGTVDCADGNCFVGVADLAVCTPDEGMSYALSFR